MKKILVIDDDDGLRRILKAALSTFGYEVLLTQNGEEGIRRAREWVPDLILCDVNMPGMDGREVLKALRSDPKLADRQVVLMTGDAEANTQREGMNLGADDYLPKPFEITHLRTCVEARLNRAQTYRRLEDGMLRRHAELFGSTLPHEFMTPLNGILGFADLLKEDLGKTPPEESLQMLNDIASCARRLHRTLMNYLTLVTIENTSTESKSGENDRTGSDQAVQAISESTHSVAQNAERLNDLKLELQPLPVFCNQGDLRMIVEHLAGNAFGFSLFGEPVMVSYLMANGHPTLTVVDRGRGMNREQIEQIGLFMQFERKRFEQQGLGIGLAIVKRLVERNDAKLSFSSVPNQGTTVEVKFKAA